jgi:hypothetical protein
MEHPEEVAEALHSECEARLRYALGPHKQTAGGTPPAHTTRIAQ